jgi:hypothetical protein
LGFRVRESKPPLSNSSTPSSCTAGPASRAAQLRITLSKLKRFTARVKAPYGEPLRIGFRRLNRGLSRVYSIEQEITEKTEAYRRRRLKVLRVQKRSPNSELAGSLSSQRKVLENLCFLRFLLFPSE